MLAEARTHTGTRIRSKTNTKQYESVCPYVVLYVTLAATMVQIRLLPTAQINAGAYIYTANRLIVQSIARRLIVVCQSLPLIVVCRSSVRQHAAPAIRGEIALAITHRILLTLTAVCLTASTRRLISSLPSRCNNETPTPSPVISLRAIFHTQYSAIRTSGRPRHTRRVGRHY